MIPPQAPNGVGHEGSALLALAGARCKGGKLRRAIYYLDS